MRLSVVWRFLVPFYVEPLITLIMIVKDNEFYISSLLIGKKNRKVHIND